jgi:hypothetical protein
MSETLSDKLKRLGKIKKAERRAKTRADALRDERAQLEKECFDLMEAEDGVASSRKLDGLSYAPARTVYGTIQDLDAFIAWAQENDLGLIETAARESLLNQLVRTAIDNDEALPPGVGYYTREKIGIRGLKASLNEGDDDE